MRRANGRILFTSLMEKNAISIKRINEKMNNRFGFTFFKLRTIAFGPRTKKKATIKEITIPFPFSVATIGNEKNKR